MLVTSSSTINLTSGLGDVWSVKPGIPSLTMFTKGYSNLYWLSLENDI